MNMKEGNTAENIINNELNNELNPQIDDSLQQNPNNIPQYNEDSDNDEDDKNTDNDNENNTAMYDEEIETLEHERNILLREYHETECMLSDHKQFTNLSLPSWHELAVHMNDEERTILDNDDWNFLYSPNIIFVSTLCNCCR
jgi:hypothetical protein